MLLTIAITLDYTFHSIIKTICNSYQSQLDMDVDITYTVAEQTQNTDAVQLNDVSDTYNDHECTFQSLS